MKECYYCQKRITKDEPTKKQRFIAVIVETNKKIDFFPPVFYHKECWLKLEQARNNSKLKVRG